MQYTITTNLENGVENKHSYEHFINISISSLGKIKVALKELNTILNKHPIRLGKPLTYKL
jgi:hypothetical protein